MRYLASFLFIMTFAVVSGESSGSPGVSKSKQIHLIGKHDSGAIQFQELITTSPGTEKVIAEITAYCPCVKCCGKHADGRTAWWGGDSKGFAKEPGLAADPKAVPYGSRVFIPKVGWRQIDDTGGAMRKAWRIQKKLLLDLRFNSHDAARQWGRKTVTVLVQRS